MKRTLPVSIYSAFSFGNTSCVNAAQCGQVIDAYSMIVTGASLEPKAMSPNELAFATSSADCAWASDNCQENCQGEMPMSAAAKPIKTNVVKNVRRMIFNGLLQ